MALRIAGRVTGRHDDRVAATPDGWVTASPRALTRWQGDEPAGDPWVVYRPWPGRLCWLAEAGALAWGPIVVRDDAPAWPIDAVTGPPTAELGSGAAKLYEVVDGVVSGDGRLAAVSLHRRQPRTIGSGSVGDTERLAIVDPAGGELVEQLEPGRLTSMLWGDGPLALGFTARLDVRAADGSWASADLDEHSGVTALADAGGGAVAVGTAGGRVGVWSGVGPIETHPAHDGPVTALSALGSHVLLSGGHDGRLRVWDGSAMAAELDLGAPVLDLAVEGRRAAVVVDHEGSETVFVDIDEAIGLDDA